MQSGTITSSGATRLCNPGLAGKRVSVKLDLFKIVATEVYYRGKLIARNISVTGDRKGISLHGR